MNLHYRFYCLIDSAWRRRYLIALPMLLLPMIGYGVGTQTPKRYLAHTSMLIQETSKMNPFLEDLAVSAMLKERMSALQTLLHSRHILGAVAIKQGLWSDDLSQDERDRVIARLSNALTVVMVGKDLIRINYASDTPKGMAQTLTLVSDHFIEQLLAPERSSIVDSSFFLAQMLDDKRQELDAAELQLADFLDGNAMQLPQYHGANMTRLAALKQQLAEREAELAGAAKNLGTLDQQLSRTNPVVGQLEEQIVAMRGELAVTRARYHDGHSQVKGLLRNIERLESERQSAMQRGNQTIDPDTLWDMVNARLLTQTDAAMQPLLISQLQSLQQARSRVDGLTEEIVRLKQMIIELEAATTSLGGQQRILARMQRDINVKSELYQELAKRYEMAKVTGSLGNFEHHKRVKIIDRPYTPTRPVNLPPALFAIAGLFAGAFLGGGLATVLAMLDITARRKRDVEAWSGVKVLVRLPSLEQQAN
jgi:polysaccharide chain length determinant protein (PEP-CTERM system associated)